METAAKKVVTAVVTTGSSSGSNSGSSYVDKLKTFISDYGFNILVFAAIAFIVIVFVYNVITGQKGTYYNGYRDFIAEVAMGSAKQKLGIYNTTSPTGYESKGEAECRRIVEKFTGKKFTRARPNFLRNSITGSNLELDCYNDEMKLAVEYNGQQHYEYVPHFHANKEAFQNTRYRDEMKARLCADNGVKLIVVPYTVALSEIERYIAARM